MNLEQRNAAKLFPLIKPKGVRRKKSDSVRHPNNKMAGTCGWGGEEGKKKENKFNDSN